MIIFHPFNGNGGSQLIAKYFLEISRNLKVNRSVNCIVGFGKKGFLNQEKVLFNIENKYLRIFLLPIISVYLNFHFLPKNKIIGVTIFSIYSLILNSIFNPKSVIIYLHEIPNSRVLLAILRFFVKRKVQLLFVSNFHKNEIGLEGEVIYNFVEQPIQKFIPTPNNRLIFVGSGNLKKGFDVFLEICKILSCGDYKFDAYLNSSTKELEDEARLIGVNVYYDITEKNKFFKDGGVLLQPSRAKETFSLVSLEAASWGIPVVTFNQEVLKEIFLEENILDFKLGNSRCIPDAAEAIIKLLEDEQHYFNYSLILKERSKIFNVERFEKNIKHFIDKGMFNRN